MNWLRGYPEALPDHLKDKLHTDWPPLLNKLPRSINARGPRCGEGKPGFMMWPPRLVEGYDVVRWEWSDLEGKTHDIVVPEFARKTIGPDVYDKQWVAIIRETEKEVTVDLNQYWPSIIQKYSEHGWLKLNPSFRCGWRTTPNWKRFYWRTGWRPDYEQYYNWGPYVGRNFE